ncbi:MAG: MFS transporter [Paracoccaceae bacterium]|nr:MFS transporter [Paracoccaceae bacterium]
MTDTTIEAETDRRRLLRRMMLLLGLFFVMVQVNRSAGGVLATYLGGPDGLSPTDIGTVMGTMFIASAMIQLPTGILFDWLGPRRTLSYMGAVAVAGIVIFALAESVLGMMVGRFAMGAGHGGVITAIYLIAMVWAPPERVAQSTATVVGIAGGIGGIMATTPLAFALDEYGLTVSFLGIAALTGVTTLALFFGLRDEPAETRAGPAADAPPETFADPPRETLGQTIAGLWTVMRMPELRRIYAMGFCFAAPFMTIGGLWAGPYFTEVHGLDAEGASLILLSLIVALHLGTFLYGPLERRVRSRRRLILAGVALQVGTLSVLVLWPQAPLPLAIVLLVIFGCAAPFYVVLAAHTQMFVPKRRLGRAMTCIGLVGLTGIFIMQTGTGALIDLVQRLGGSSLTGHRLVFFSVILILAFSAAIYRRQPEAPAEVEK